MAANVITAGTNLISGDLVTANGSKSVSDSGIVASNVITASTNLVSGDLVSANGSKTLTDSCGCKCCYRGSELGHKQSC